MIVLLHGMGMSAGVWDAVRSNVPDAIAIDLPGHGTRAQEAPLDDIDAMARDVAERIGTQRAVVVGHSMGGAVAQALVHHHPERVERAILVASALRFPAAPVMLEAARADITSFRGMFKDGLGRGAVRGKALVDACSDEALLADIAACAAFDARQWLSTSLSTSTVREPARPAVVVVGGDLDDIVPPKAWRRLAELWGARLVEAGPHDHGLPETYAAEIARLCAAPS